MEKVLRTIFFGFILLFAVIKDVFDILGNLAAAFGGNIISTIVDVICITMIVLLNLLQRGELRSFFDFSRKHIIKAMGWLLEIIPIGTDFLPITTAIVIYDYAAYSFKMKREEAENKEIEKKQKIEVEQEKENLKNIQKEQNKKENEKENIQN